MNEELAVDDRIDGLVRGLKVLEAFRPGTPRLTVTEAATATGLSRPVARRYLLTLEYCGYLIKSGNYFELTPRAAKLASWVPADKYALSKIAQRFIDLVRDEIDETTSIAVLTESEVEFIARAESTNQTKSAIRVGVRVPAYNSATGRVLLAATPDDNIERYLATHNIKAYTPNAPKTAQETFERIIRARADGYATTDEELNLGVLTAAVPVRDQAGAVLAALSINISSSRATMDELHARYVPLLQRRAEQLGNFL